MSFDFLAAIKNIAPTLVGTFLGPLAGMGVKTLVDFIPDEHKATVNAALTSGGTDGAIAKLGELFQQGAINAVQIKQAEAAHAEKMAELGFKNAADLEQIAAGDRASARQREAAVKDRTPAVLATVIVVGALVLSYCIISGNAPAMKDATTAALAGAIVGYVFAEVKAVYQYYFGSSAGSQAKDSTIKSMAES